MAKQVINKTITINAAPEKVWDALTNPEKTKQYFFRCEVQSDWKPGSSIIFKGEPAPGQNIELKGKIIQIQPGQLLKYTVNHSTEPGYSTVTDVLKYQDGKTILSISDDVGETPGVEERIKKSEQGWEMVLNGLKQLVEKKS